MTLFIEKKKNKQGKEYVALYADLGYRTISITFDSTTIAELGNMTMRQLSELEVDSKIEIGKLN